MTQARENAVLESMYRQYVQHEQLHGNPVITRDEFKERTNAPGTIEYTEYASRREKVAKLYDLLLKATKPSEQQDLR